MLRKGNIPHDRLDLPEEEILLLFRSGCSLRDIGKHFNCFRSVIHRILARSFSPEEIQAHGRKAQSVKTSGDQHCRHLALPVQEIIQRFLAGESSPDLATAYSCSQTLVKKTLRKHLSADVIKEHQYASVSRKMSGRFPGRRYDQIHGTSGIAGKKFSKEQCAHLRLVQPRGKDHHNWKGGVSSESELFVMLPEWKEVAQAVRVRDRFTCRVCFKDHVSIVHHLIPRNLDPERRIAFEQDNGLTVCKSCHGIIEPRGWKTIPTAAEVVHYYGGHGIRIPFDLVCSLLHKFNGTEPLPANAGMLEFAGECIITS